MSNIQFHKANKPLLVLDVSPLWELEYTGVSNVVHELARRFFLDKNSDFDIKFSVFSKLVNTSLIEICLLNRSGFEMQAAFQTGDGITEMIVDDFGRIEGRRSFGIFFHRKPNKKVFYKDSQFIFDFSVVLTPECHAPETVISHMDGLIDQIASSDLFFCISESTASDLRWLFNVPKAKSVVALLGHNVDEKLACHARDKIFDSEVEPYFLMLGTIEPRKNIALIFEWLNKNPGILKKFRFVFVGRNGWGPTFLDYVEKYDLASSVESGRIVHLGYVDEALKATLIVGARAIFYPSIFEGFGLPVLEAMALGVPVIASCSTSIPEVLGDAGYYFDPYSVDSLDKAFSSFLFDECGDRLNLLRKKAKERASEFSYDRTYSVICNSLRENFLENDDRDIQDFEALVPIESHEVLDRSDSSTLAALIDVNEVMVIVKADQIHVSPSKKVKHKKRR
jgi:glycosyltransferase involved in cell wall biosynthesis